MLSQIAGLCFSVLMSGDTACDKMIEWLSVFFDSEKILAIAAI